MDTLFLCSNCDAQYPKWMGQCLECGKWGTISEGSAPAARPHEVKADVQPSGNVVPLASVAGQDVDRLKTNIQEFDRVLGGGIVPGSLVLVGGDPGIGKSTLLLQVASAVAVSVLYVSGEESAPQVKMRFDRLEISSDAIQFLGEEDSDVVVKTIIATRPRLAIIDSIQTMYSGSVDGEPGSVTQIRAATAKLLDVAKHSAIPILIIGHVTKEGTLGGPKTLEHLVDTVLYFEGDENHYYRILRAVKNRFGSTQEIGVFEMREGGLKQVLNPSKIFLENAKDHTPGSVVCSLMEGTRPIFVEIQALVTRTVFGYPQRKVSGFDVNRLQVLLAVLGKRAGVDTGNFDVHVNCVGGLRVSEPAADLAVCFAIASARRDIPLPQSTMVCGEVGLGGEVRMVPQLERRIQEAQKLGFTHAIVPEGKLTPIAGISVLTVSNLSNALLHLFGSK